MPTLFEGKSAKFWNRSQGRHEDEKGKPAKPSAKTKAAEKADKKHKEVDETALLAAIDAVSVTDDVSLRNIGLSLLSESLPEYGVSSGTTVAAISDPTYPFEGVKGKVRGPSAKGSGFVDVEYPNGVVVAMQSSLLIPV